jgi:hypothetical protein
LSLYYFILFNLEDCVYRSAPYSVYDSDYQDKAILAAKHCCQSKATFSKELEKEMFKHVSMENAQGVL